MIDDQTTDASLFHRLGGDPAIAAFVARFYDIMAADPQLERIWAWHPKDMAGLKARLGDFLSGFLGGPTLYPQRYGPPMMRRRHLPFPIGRAERDLWMKCARAALAETVGDPAPRAELEGRSGGVRRAHAQSRRRRPTSRRVLRRSRRRPARRRSELRLLLLGVTPQIVHGSDGPPLP